MTNNNDKPSDEPQTLEEIFGQVCYSFSRAAAIDDGVLVAVPELDAMLAGIRVPMAVNSSVWGASKSDELAYRLAMLQQCRAAIATVPTGEDRVYFRLSLPKGDGMDVVLHCGPGDTAEPVLTVCEPGDL